MRFDKKREDVDGIRYKSYSEGNNLAIWKSKKEDYRFEGSKIVELPIYSRIYDCRFMPESFRNKINQIIINARSEAKKLQSEGIRIQPPSEKDEEIVLPINCWYDINFFRILYILKDHNIAGVRVSEKFQIPQILIPVNKNNKEQNLEISILREKGQKYLPEANNVWEIIEKECKLLKELGVLAEWNSREGQEARNVSADYWKSFKKYFEPIFEQGQKQFGYIKYSSEYLFYKIIQTLFEDAIYQYHADWLQFQSIDVYIPSKKVAIEFQGVQHYEPVEFFGGAERYLNQKIADEKKLNLCQKEGVNLFYWYYGNHSRFDTVIDEFIKKGICTKEELEKRLANGLNVAFPKTVMELLLQTQFIREKGRKPKKPPTKRKD